VDYTGKTVLLMGAGGFIDSHLAEELVTCGAPARGFLLHNSHGRQGNLAGVASEIRRDFEIGRGDLTYTREQRVTKN
jgi:hypothetical protein